MQTELDVCPNWYVIHTHPKQEDRAERNLAAWGITTFTPKVREPRRSQYARAVYAIKPLFPRYIFAQFRIKDSFHKLRFTRGVHEVVSFSGFPAPVDEEIISTIRSRVDREGLVRLGQDFKPGEEVVIGEGPLASIKGVFECESTDTDRVTILLTAVRYQARLVIERHALKKAGPAGY